MYQEFEVTNTIKLVLDEERSPSRNHGAARHPSPTVTLHQLPYGAISQMLASKAAEQSRGLQVVATERQIQISTVSAVKNSEDVLSVIESFIDGLTYAMRRQANVAKGRAARSSSRSKQYFNNPTIR